MEIEYSPLGRPLPYGPYSSNSTWERVPHPDKGAALVGWRQTIGGPDTPPVRSPAIPIAGSIS